MKLRFFLAPAVALGCGGAHNTPLIDASYGPDRSAVDAGSPDAPTTCEPADASAYNPDMMHPPNPANAGKCTMQQAMDYAACEGGQTAKCSEFGVGQPAQDCGECIETQYTDKTWGVVVFQNSIGTINREGCVDDALSEVSEEHASGGKGSCGDLLYASYGCQDVVCGTCVGDDLTTCDETAIETQCEGYDKAVENTSGPCAELFGDAAPPASTSCFPNTSITDLASQQTDYLTRIVQYMCGTN